MTGRRPELSEVGTNDLERVLGVVARLPEETAISRGMLVASRLGHAWDAIDALTRSPTNLQINAGTVALVLRAVLSERESKPLSQVDLVWTGGEGKTAYSRPTAAVVRELFEQAERHVLIAGYSFDHGSSILAPLHARMSARGVEVDIYLHVDRARRPRDVPSHVERAVATFFAANWPFGPPHPAIYIAPGTIEPGSTESLHAKCVVADERVAVVGSANFTDRGQSRNVEVGARIEHASFARALVAQFRAATHAGVFRAFDVERAGAKT